MNKLLDDIQARDGRLRHEVRALVDEANDLIPRGTYVRIPARGIGLVATVSWGLCEVGLEVLIYPTSGGAPFWINIRDVDILDKEPL